MSFTKNVAQIFQTIKPTLKGTDRRTCERMLIVHAEKGKIFEKNKNSRFNFGFS